MIILDPVVQSFDILISAIQIICKTTALTCSSYARTSMTYFAVMLYIWHKIFSHLRQCDWYKWKKVNNLLHFILVLNTGFQCVGDTIAVGLISSYFTAYYNVAFNIIATSFPLAIMVSAPLTQLLIDLDGEARYFY